MSFFNLVMITFVTFVLVLLGMGVGYFLKGKVLQGSCGGLGKLMGKDCDICENKDQCRKDEG